ncbi:domain-containing 11 isoform X1 [Podarcis lilfordi]|uniref:Domain-containing 11 isoform X1 n=1 Tax=Podarcis lilfordi TaxID=74358 RepID=A0AA35L8Y3_9SAUR|nr:domain-containing 11 isoform X1 [Podarcis lilfordi]
MSACGGPGLDSGLPSAPPEAPQHQQQEEEKKEEEEKEKKPQPPWLGASRMARRPEVLCGAAVVLSCALLVALKVTCSRAKDVTMPAKLPVSFFSSTSPVCDLFLGQLDRAEDIRQDSEITLFFFYAPWCGQSVAVREEIEKVASSLADQVLFVAINCWWNQGKCRKQKHFFYFPVIYLYHRSFGPIEYKGPMNAVYIEKFVRRVMTPLLYISSRSKLQQFLSNYEPGVLGYFEFNASPQPPGYLTFFTSALHSLNKDYLGTIHFGVITDKLIAKEVPLTSSGSVYLHRHVNASLLYPHEAMNYTAENVWKWALENRETFIRWLRPHGGKSLLLNNELKKGPALFLFLPFDPLAESHPLVDEISELALEYKSCNRSHAGEAVAGHLQGGASSASGIRLPLAEAISISKSPCCNTVVLPPQWHSITRTHNVCELCINQTVGVRPSRLGGLHCNFLEIEAALDSFYLKERTFFQVMSKTDSLCSNFLSFYSPFSYYTACCRTVSGTPLGFSGSEELALASHGKRWKDDPQSSIPHIEDRSGLIPENALCDTYVTGLSCRTNKTLNLYLLDSNLFWLYAERLGASRSTPVKEFAAIVDLKEETHYILDQDQALLKSNLEIFIQNYSVLYSPLKRHLVGDTRPSRIRSQHVIREIFTDTFHEVTLRSEKDILLVYYAPWCGFCMSLNHIFIQLARILPADNFLVARIDVSQNDLPWEFMTDRLPSILFFPHDRKEQSVKFPAEFPVTLPNLLKFILCHSSQPSPASGPEPCLKGCLRQEAMLQQGHISHLQREVEKLRAEIQALHRAQAQLQSQLSEARREGQRLQQETRILRKQQGALQSQREHLQGLYEQKTRELEDMAEKLQELADASENLLTENTLLKVLVASVERELGTKTEPEFSLPKEEEVEEAGLAAEPAPDTFHEAEQNANTIEGRIAPEHSKENWTE